MSPSPANPSQHCFPGWKTVVCDNDAGVEPALSHSSSMAAQRWADTGPWCVFYGAGVARHSHVTGPAACVFLTGHQLWIQPTATQCWHIVCDCGPELHQRRTSDSRSPLTDTPSKQGTYHQRRLNVGPPSQTVDQHSADVGPTSRPHRAPSTLLTTIQLGQESPPPHHPALPRCWRGERHNLCSTSLFRHIAGYYVTAKMVAPMTMWIIMNAVVSVVAFVTLSSLDRLTLFP